MDASVGTPKTSLMAGASWLLVAKTFAFAITTILPLLLVRRLSQLEYGYYKQLFLLLQSATNYLPFGMGMSLFYFLPRAQDQREKGNVVLGVLLFHFATTIAAGTALVVHPAFVQDLFHSQTLTLLGRQIGLTIVPYVVTSLFELILVANSETRLSAVIIITINIVRTLFILIAALVWGTIGSILSALAFALVFQSVWMAIYLVRRFGFFWLHFKWRLLWDQLSCALPLGVAGLLWALQMDLHNYFVSHYFDSALFAVYSIGCFQLPLVGILGDSVGSVLIPRVSSLQSTNSVREIIELTAKAMRGLAAVYIPLFAFLFVLAGPFITLLFTSRFAASIPIFRINLLLIPLGIIAVDPIMRAYMKQRFWILRMNIFLLLGLVVALFSGIRFLGLAGAIACVVAVQYMWRILQIRRTALLLDLRWEHAVLLRDLWKIAAAAAIAATCAFFLLSQMVMLGAFLILAICGTVFTSVYFAALFALKVPSEAEIGWMRDAVIKLRVKYLPPTARPIC